MAVLGARLRDGGGGMVAWRSWGTVAWQRWGRSGEGRVTVVVTRWR
ncbi:hypothetical protein GCM10008915_43630 [Bifidobacterium pullorum subsp. gallinarum]